MFFHRQGIGKTPAQHLVTTGGDGWCYPLAESRWVSWRSCGSDGEKVGYATVGLKDYWYGRNAAILKMAVETDWLEKDHWSGMMRLHLGTKGFLTVWES